MLGMQSCMYMPKNYILNYQKMQEFGISALKESRTINQCIILTRALFEN